MNILLTQRKWHQNSGDNSPIAILDLAPYLRKIRHEVDCFFIDEIPNKEYEIIGLSIFTSYKKKFIEDIKYLKNRFKKAKIVVGGKFIKSLNKIEKKLLEKEEIDICYKSGEEYFSGENNIDFINYPSWDIKDFKTLQIKGNHLMSSRGCPYNCNFCNNTEKKISFFPAKRTVDNIELMFKLKKPYVFFVDDIFTIKINHILNIYKECKKRNVPIEGRNRFFTHINLINKETAKMMGLFKPVNVSVGLESGDDRMLKLMGKPFTAKKAYEKIKLLAKYVPVHGLFLIGYPGETIESLNNTVKFAKKIKNFLVSKWVSYYQPVPNTVGYNLAKKYGKIINERQDNQEVTYVDNNLSKEILIKYKNLILAI